MRRKQIPVSLTKEEVKQISKELFELRFSEWVEKNWENADAYEYERSFDLMMKECLHELMQLAAGPTPQDKNLKKTNDLAGSNSNPQATSASAKQ